VSAIVMSQLRFQFGLRDQEFRCEQPSAFQIYNETYVFNALLQKRSRVTGVGQL
jgi:hypothetical protein